MVSCRFGTKDAIAHFNHIQIYFHNTLFSPEKLDQYGEICFYCLAEVGARVEGEDILSRLLGDRAAPTFDAAIALVLFISTCDCLPIKTPMLVELGILVIDNSRDELGGNIF